MINRIKSWFSGIVYSLRTKMLFFILIGAIASVGIYISVNLIFTTVVDTYYNSDEARLERQEKYLADLQRYVTENELSSEDTPDLVKWVKNNRYIYLLIYKDDEPLFSEGSYGENLTINTPGFSGEGGITVTYPEKDDLEQYAKENAPHPLEMSDVVLGASFADFSEYFYYDMANIVSIIVAFVFLAMILTLYLGDITARLSGLSEDVMTVSEGDMSHKITAEGKDELATLSRNVENMRISVLENLEKEREARDANTQLITSMSHDLRTPLTILLGYIDIMKMRTEDSDMLSYLKASEATVLRLKSFSDATFEYFHVFGGGKLDIELVDYEAKTLFDQLFAEHLLLLKEQEYIIDFLGDESIMPGMTIRTDAPKTMRIIDNIFSNLVKYADKEFPISIGVGCSECEGGSSYIDITVVNRISEQLSAESNRIGLKTCKKLADAMGLRFEAERLEDMFRVKLSLPVSRGNGTDSEFKGDKVNEI